MPAPENSPQAGLRRLGQLIREAREDLGLTQVELAERSGVGRATIQRYENARVDVPEFDKVRALFKALDVHPGEIPVALGIVTREEMGLPPERVRPRRFDPAVEEILTLITDDRVSPQTRIALRELLRAQLAQHRPVGGAKAG